MKKIIWILAILIFAMTVNIFGQSKRKKVSYALPEVGDEVLVGIRKKNLQTKNVNSRKSKRSKYANQEISYRKKSKSRKIRGITHDPEFEYWANRKIKIKKSRRK